MSTVVIYSIFMFVAAVLGWIAARYQWKFTKSLLAALPFIGYTIYLYFYFVVFTPSSEGPGVPMLPALYISLCLPFAVASIVAFNLFRKRK